MDIVEISTKRKLLWSKLAHINDGGSGLRRSLRRSFPAERLANLYLKTKFEKVSPCKNQFVIESAQNPVTDTRHAQIDPCAQIVDAYAGNERHTCSVRKLYSFQRNKQVSLGIPFRCPTESNRPARRYCIINTPYQILNFHFQITYPDFSHERPCCSKHR